MSAGGAFGGARGVQAKAPEKGVFPLDHFGECSQEKAEYLRCLSESNYVAEKCTHLARDYLQCRMDKGLMAEQSLEELGLAGVYVPANIEAKSDTSRSAKGFTAGVRSSSGVSRQ